MCASAIFRLCFIKYFITSFFWNLDIQQSTLEPMKLAIPATKIEIKIFSEFRDSTIPLDRILAESNAINPPPSE